MSRARGPQTRLRDARRLTRGIRLAVLPTQATEGRTLSICDADCNEVARVRGSDVSAERVANLLSKAPQLAARLQWALTTLSNMELSAGQMDSLRRAQADLDQVIE